MNRAENNRPVLITIKSELERLERDREEIAAMLEGLKQDLQSMQERLRSGETEKRSEGGSLLGDLKYWLRQANETEKEIEAIRRKDCAIVEGYGLDLEQAGLEIGCRLAGLRACCGADEVSG
ncbi:hypothetical protein [Tropicibacter oceani]|uniref:Uncharacterized protein n=1 Tax=Tropicibacter oceani TaxID=3058420 RepID=A0ABY8QEP4_9RHOB|nr:hypothetical protein [Tropicibacter oceani]WGW02506.1 hypothetical protein QF118_11170 [Tropicibacter oceani]